MLIADLVRRYESALSTRDISKIEALYGSDPVFMPQHAPAQVGRDAVLAMYNHVFETATLNVVFEIHEVQESGEWAWARSSSVGKIQMLAAGVEVIDSNNDLFVFRREGREWRIHRYIFATSQPRA